MELATRGKETLVDIQLRISALYIVCLGYLKLGDLLSYTKYMKMLLQLELSPILDEDGPVFVRKLYCNCVVWLELERGRPDNAEKMLQASYDILTFFRSESKVTYL